MKTVFFMLNFKRNKKFAVICRFCNCKRKTECEVLMSKQ